MLNFVAIDFETAKRVQLHGRKGRYRSTKSTGDMGFRFPHHNFASCVGDPIEKVIVDQSPI